MLTRFSKWMIYMSSYCILYLLLIIRIFGFSTLGDKTLTETWFFRFESNKVLIISLLVLFVVSIIWTRAIPRWKNNTRVKYRLRKNATIDMAIFLVTFIVPMITIDIDGFGIVLTILLFIFFGVAFVLTDIIHISPVFLMLGYKLYSSETVHILSKRSLEEINLLLDEDIEGIPGRELCKNTYILL